MKEETHLIYVKIPEQLTPFERGEKYEDPLGEILENKALGFVSGGGTMLSAPDEKGQREIEFCGVDVEVYELENGIKFLKEELKRLNVPKGTILEFEANGQQKTVEI